VSLPDVQFVDEAPPSDPDDVSEPAGRPKTKTCSQCGKTFDVSPHGRIPTKCPEHRKGSSTGTRGGRKRTQKYTVKEYQDKAFEVIVGYVTTPLFALGLGFPHPGPAATGFAIQYQASPREINPETGEILVHGALPEAIGEIAEQEVKIANLLVQLTKATPYVKLATALLPIVPQVGVNFGLFKPGAFGTADPHAIQETLRSRMVEGLTDQFVPFSDVIDGMNSNGSHG